MQKWGAALAVLAPVLYADGAAAQTGFAEMLRMLPDTKPVYASVPMLTYVDFRAVEAAAGLGSPASEEEFDAWTDEDIGAWGWALRRLADAPRELIDYAGRMSGNAVTLREAIGFDFFAVDRAMTFNMNPPHSVIVLAGDGLAGSAAIGAALEPRTFELRDVKGVPVWGRFEDDQMVMDLDDPQIEGDPFGTQFRRGSRIAVLPDTVVVSYHWPDIESVLTTSQGREPPAAAATLLEAMRGAVLSLDGVGGVILQAWVAPVNAVAFVDRIGPLLLESLGSGEIMDSGELAEAMAEGPSGPALPPYPLVMLADLQAGPDQVNVIALPYPDRGSAEAAAEAVSARLAAWNPRDDPEPLVEILGGRIESKIVDAPGLMHPIAATYLALAEEGAAESVSQALGDLATEEGGAVALIAVRYPLPAPDDEAAPGALLREWLGGIYRREMEPLALQ
jgi:hypothetical protein